MRVRVSTLRSFVRKALREHAEGQHGRDFDESPGYSGDADMARTQLKNIADRAAKLHDALEDGDDLPAWVLSKMAVADSYMTSLSDYLHGEIDREGDEGGYTSEYEDEGMASEDMDMESMLSSMMGGMEMDGSDDDAMDSDEEDSDGYGDPEMPEDEEDEDTEDYGDPELPEDDDDTDEESSQDDD